MDARQRLIRAAANLEPHRQGDLDGLCGIYALINWIQLGLYPELLLTPGERRWLFEHGVEFVGATRHLNAVVTSGMSSALWKRLARSMLDEASGLTGLQLRVDRVLGPNRPTSAKLQQAIALQLEYGRPVILTLWGRYNHTTVAYAASAHRLRLFDSFGFKWITLGSIELYRPGAVSRHSVRSASTYALTVER